MPRGIFLSVFRNSQSFGSYHVVFSLFLAPVYSLTPIDGAVPYRSCWPNSMNQYGRSIVSYVQYTGELLANVKLYSYFRKTVNQFILCCRQLIPLGIGSVVHWECCLPTFCSLFVLQLLNSASEQPPFIRLSFPYDPSRIVLPCICCTQRHSQHTL